MTDPIGPKSPAGATGSPVYPEANDPAPPDQAMIDTLKLQLRMYEASGSAAPPQVVAKMKEVLAALEAGYTTVAEAQAAFEKAKAEATDASIDQMTNTMIGIVANEAVKATNNPFLEEIKKELEDDQ